MPVTRLYGLLAEFDSADALIAAAKKTRAAGYTHIEAFSPYPLPEAAEALGCRRSGVQFLVLLGGVLGGSAAFFMLYWVSAAAWPLNIGGRPPNSWPMFIPITFELTVLTASLAAFLSVFVLCRLPRFHHPLFGSPLFARSSTDRFYLCIETSDATIDVDEVREFLATLNPAGIEEVFS
jgi:hypothetical protein